MALKSKNVLQSKVFPVARTNTTLKSFATLPRDAQIVGISIFGATASDAATTATVQVKSAITDGSAAAANLTGAIDVKGQNGLQVLTGATNIAVANPVFFTGTGKPQYIQAVYAESGTASTTGGPWYVKIDFM